MQLGEPDLTWATDLVDSLVTLIIDIFWMGWGLLPEQSDYSLSVEVWFLIAFLSGFMLFMRYYSNGIIWEAIEYFLSETAEPYTREQINRVRNYRYRKR